MTQRRDPRPRRRRRREARRRPQAARGRAGDPRRRDPGDGPPRPDPAVGARARRLPGAGQGPGGGAARSSTTRSALADAGCFAIVLECVPDAVARLVTDTVAVPTIGIGAGRHCDGQVLVFHDLLGLEDRVDAEVRAPLRRPRGRRDGRGARGSPTTCAGRFPSSDETYHAADDVAEDLRLYSGDARTRSDVEHGAPPGRSTPARACHSPAWVLAAVVGRRLVVGSWSS